MNKLLIISNINRILPDILNYIYQLYIELVKSRFCIWLTNCYQHIRYTNIYKHLKTYDKFSLMCTTCDYCKSEFKHPKSLIVMLVIHWDDAMYAFDYITKYYHHTCYQFLLKSCV